MITYYYIINIVRLYACTSLLTSKTGHSIIVNKEIILRNIWKAVRTLS